MVVVMSYNMRIPLLYLYSITLPYTATKVGAEALCRAYYKSFKMPVIILGPGQIPEKVIPAFICRRFQGLPLFVQGDGSAKRCFLYDDDGINALMTIQQFGKDGEDYNIANRDEFSVLELANRLVSSIPSDIFSADSFYERS